MGACVSKKHGPVIADIGSNSEKAIRNGSSTFAFSYHYKGQDWWEFCTIGKSQSPINIEESAEDAADLQVVNPDSSDYRPLQLSHPPTQMITCTRGNGSYMVKDCITGSFTGVVIGAAEPQRFDFRNLHFHCASEHQLNGKSFPLEMHIVHQDKSLVFAVIAVWFVETKEESRLLKAVTQRSSLDLDEEVGSIIEDFYFYSGSLTTPPCTEPVHWFIRREPLRATRQQLRFFRDMWPDNSEFASGNGNNREIQPRNGRTVFRFQKNN